ncbi:hypothetical protein AMECASPLE_038001 [Ameca splendens]|uniref:Uncharacterized protein n=1 Tax=Ameca splendens TaxID=208324 RepID=A0ABV0XWX6_9TELE
MSSAVYRLSFRSCRWRPTTVIHALNLSKTEQNQPEPKMKLSPLQRSQASVGASLISAGKRLDRVRRTAVLCGTGDGCPPEKTSHRCPSGCQNGWSGSFTDMGNTTEMQALHSQSLLTCVLLQMQSEPVSEQAQELLLGLP